MDDVNERLGWKRVWRRIIKQLTPRTHWKKKIISRVVSHIRNDDNDNAPVGDDLIGTSNVLEMRIFNAQEQATDFWEKYQELGNIDDLDMTISFEREIVNLVTEDDIQRQECLRHLAMSLIEKFNCSGSLTDLEEAITLQQQAIEIVLENTSTDPTPLDMLARSLWYRFKELGEANDLENAASLRKQAVDLTPDGHVDKPMRLCNLGNLFLTQFELLGEVADIDQAVLLHQKAANLTTDGHASKPGCLNNLGNSLQCRFERFGEMADIDQAILVQQQAVNMTPDSCDDKSVRLNNLGNSFLRRFEQSGDMADIDQAILAQQQAVNLTLDGSASKPGRLNNLGHTFLSRFKRLGEVLDINNAISMQQQAVNLTPDGHSTKPGRLNNLGISFQSRFEWFGDVADINQALLVQHLAVDHTPDGHADKPGYLNNLGSSFRSSFGRFGKVADIDEAILLQQQAVNLTPNDHADKPGRLNNLGNSFRNRFELFGEVTDIDKAIFVQEQSVRLSPDDHADTPSYLDSLGNSFLMRFERFGEASDIDKAILLQSQAIDVIPDGHANKPGCLNNLGISLQVRFQWFGEVADIDRAIMVQQEAVILISDGHANGIRPSYLNNLGNSLLKRFEYSGEIADVEQAVSMQRQAVDLTSDGHVEKPIYLQNLGDSLNIQFRITSDVSHLHQSISAFSASALSLVGLPRIRLNSARSWALFASNFFSTCLNPDLSSLHACHTVMELVPRVVWLGNSISLRYQDIADIGDAVNMAASVACSFNRPDLAFEWLEQGRSIVWGQMLHLRTPMDDLQSLYPELATSMKRLSERLELLSTAIDKKAPSLLTTDGYHYTSLEQSAREHRRLVEQWEAQLFKVRQCPGYQNFLLPKTLMELGPAAKSGPVVFVNIYESRCDALILQSIKNLPQLDHVQLPSELSATVKAAYLIFGQALATSGFRPRNRDLRYPSTAGSVAGMSTNDRSSFAVSALGRMEDVLEELWTMVVQPVIQKLGYIHAGTDKTGKTLPHITWCTTGQLAFLPLHAAGSYTAGSQARTSRAYDYVVSSYTPSISALIKCKNVSQHNFHGLTAISQPSTADNRLRLLPGTVEEVKTIKGLFLDKDFTWLNESKSTKAAVLEKMNQSSWLHLACHGAQKKDNPMESALILHDGSLDLRTISQQTLPNARLAFLSACQTATGDEDLPNEAAHLAAGMLMIGFHSVIGTMWSINDQDAPLVAEEFYKYLLTRNMKTSDGEAAYALHEAVGRLREQVGVDQFARWIPFIHLGI